jgi:hypothetical protein
VVASGSDAVSSDSCPHPERVRRAARKKTRTIQGTFLVKLNIHRLSLVRLPTSGPSYVISFILEALIGFSKPHDKAKMWASMVKVVAEM